jgi:hypothetical protein
MPESSFSVSFQYPGGASSAIKARSRMGIQQVRLAIIRGDLKEAVGRSKYPAFTPCSSHT